MGEIIKRAKDAFAQDDFNLDFANISEKIVNSSPFICYFTSDWG